MKRLIESTRKGEEKTMTITVDSLLFNKCSFEEITCLVFSYITPFGEMSMMWERWIRLMSHEPASGIFVCFLVDDGTIMSYSSDKTAPI